MTKNSATQVLFARPAAINDAEWADLSTRLMDAAAARTVPMAALAVKCPAWCETSHLHLEEALNPRAEGYFHLRTVISEPWACIDVQEYQYFLEGHDERGIRIVELDDELDADQAVQVATALANAAATLTEAKA
jgi:hypothetical protein